MVKARNAYYGNIGMIRVYCEDCETHALVIDGLKQCCDIPLDDDVEGNEFMSEPVRKRGCLTRKQRILLLNEQGSRCFYCGRRFGAIYVKKNRRRTTQVQYDHFQPYSGTFNNNFDNFVASCNICNQIKSNSVFESVDEARLHIESERLHKNIFFLDELKKKPKLKCVECGGEISGQRRKFCSDRCNSNYYSGK